MRGFLALACACALFAALAAPAALVASEAEVEPSTSGGAVVAPQQGTDAVATSASVGRQATHDVSMVAGNRFEPESITVNVGDTIMWTNKDSVAHNAIADDNSFRTDTIDGGETASVTIEKEGSFPYFCSLHAGMEGRISTPGAETETGGGSGGNRPDPGAGGGGSDDNKQPDAPTLPPGSGTDPGTQSGGGSPDSTRNDATLPFTGVDSGWLAVIGIWLLAVGAAVRTAVGRGRA